MPLYRVNGVQACDFEGLFGIVQLGLVASEWDENLKVIIISMPPEWMGGMGGLFKSWIK